MAANYTDKQVEHMITAYVKNPCRYTVDMLAEDLDKSVKSIIGSSKLMGLEKAPKQVIKFLHDTIGDVDNGSS